MSNRRHRRKPGGWGFRPPHCPNRDCHDYRPSPTWRPARDGSFLRPSDRRRFQRFRCRRCGRRYSTRTFAADYWLRRRTQFPDIVRHATEGPGLRQTARLLGTSHATVLRQLARAGRHCLLVHQEMLARVSRAEPFVIDGFETFEFSQFFPFHLNLAVGAESWFLYHFTDSPLRRKGAMTAAQKQRRAELESALGRPDPKAVEQGIAELLDSLVRRRNERTGARRRTRAARGDDPGPNETELCVHSDDHPAYRRALRRLRRKHPRLRLRHRVTSSTERRTTSNPLFPVNLADLLLRHAQAAHRRETIAFCKRRQGAIERLAVFAVWRNAVKRRRERKPGETAAMVVGALDRPWSWAEVFRARRFPRRKLLPGSWWSYYWRRVRTAVLGPRQTKHELKYAF